MIKGEWVFTNLKRYEYKFSGYMIGWFQWLYHYCHITDELEIGGTNKNSGITRLNARDYFKDFPDMSDNERLMFELQFGVSTEPLVELKEVMKQHNLLT